MPSLLFWLLVFAFILAVLPSSAYAFGAGNLPSYGYLEDRAFRHGDIEDVLAELLKRTGSGLLKQGSKFKGLDIKRVYFGNWLRDYSQAVDVAGLKATSIQNIITICTVLGFLAHGYVTDEFEVTEERLGVYLPVEHIDNPKGYPEDARNYHPKLRGPVDPRELEIDLRTGMKNYIANEDGGWDTSKALIRRRLTECINLGRKYRTSNNKRDQYEAFRLLGTALHTMEDFPAHSNFCELALVNLGYHQVFTHVGDQVRIRAPNGKTVAPLVTGTFGGDDFQHSLLGEAGDHISQSSISDLNEHMTKAKTKAASGDFGSANKIKSLLSNIPGDGQSMARDIDQMQSTRASGVPGGAPGKDPNTMTPKELYQNIWAILSFRDSLVKKISYTIEKIPGLGPLIDTIMENITVFIFQMLEPYLKPLMKTATTQLATSSAAVINKLDQYEVFHDALASDPTHSILSKDHFNLILNEPAGNLAKIILIHTVKLVVHAWDNAGDDIHHVTETILECLFHPDFHNPKSNVQKEMMQFMHTWIGKHSAGAHDVLHRLTKDAVRNHKNIRQSGDNSAPTVSASTHGHGAAVNYGHQASSKISNTLHSIPGVNQVQGFMGHMHGPPGFPSRDMPGSSTQPEYSAPPGYPGAPSVSSGYPGAPQQGEDFSYEARGKKSEKKQKHGHKKSKSGGSYGSDDSESGDSDDSKHGKKSKHDKPKKPKHDKPKKPKHDKHDKHDKYDKHGGFDDGQYGAGYGDYSPPKGGGVTMPGAPSIPPPGFQSPSFGPPGGSGYPGSSSGFPDVSSYGGAPPGGHGPGGYGSPSPGPSFPGAPPGGGYGQPYGAPGHPPYGGPSTAPGFPNMPNVSQYPGAPQQGYPDQGPPNYGGQSSYGGGGGW